MKKSLIVSFSLISTSAFAHHPLNGMPMETFTHGLFSGAGHPILGFDHLFFVLIVGVAALLTGRKFLAPLAYITAMLVGCQLTISGLNLPLKEIIIALSLLVVGSLVLSGRGLSLIPVIALFAVFGVFHGSAFAESIVGQEGGVGGSVLIGYFLGLGIVQYIVAISAGWTLQTPLAAMQAGHINARLCGAVVAGVGLFLTLEAIEGTVFAVLGIG